MNDLHELQLDRIVQVPMDIVFKSDKPESRTICGYVSTEHLDRQGEIVIQKGLNFDDFMQYGWFNDDHSKSQTDILGYPTDCQFHKGKGWYVEGELIKGHPTAERIYAIAKSLHDSPRKLGFSIQGKVEKRENNRIVKARVSHVAITHQPVNPACTLDVLTKSFCLHFEDAQCSHCIDKCEDILKSINAGGIDTSEGGAAVRKESLDGDEHATCCSEDGKECTGECKKKIAKKSFSSIEEIARYISNIRKYSDDTSLRIAKLIFSRRL